MSTKNKLGQFFNLDGIMFNLKYLFTFSINKIHPNIRAKSICELNLTKLNKEYNVKYVVFDKDNTLTLPHKKELANNHIKDKIKEFKRVFGEDNIAILSNSAGSRDDIDYKEALEIEEDTGIKVIKHEFKKPKVYKEIIETFVNRGNTEIVDNKEICVIGDRLLVDVIMGKEYGFFTILVDPITYDKDNFMVRMMRRIEKYLLKSASDKNKLS